MDKVALPNILRRLGLSGHQIISGQTRPVSSGVLQGSVLGQLAFLISINGLDEEADLATLVMKFDDATYLDHRVSSPADVEVLHSALDKLCVWAERWVAYGFQHCQV